MNEKNRNLVTRTVSSVVLLPVCILLVAKGGLWSGLFFAFTAVGCAIEFYQMTLRRLSLAAWCGVGVAFAMPLVPGAFVRSGGEWVAHSVEVCFWLAVLLLFVSWVSHLFRGSPAESLNRCPPVLWGALYAGAPLLAFALLRASPAGVQWILAAFIVTWGNDTLAYFTGRLFGRHKLSPTLSPNKTWEGFLGGGLGSIGGLFLFRAMAHTPLQAVDCWLIGGLGALLGPLGDLCESMLKRASGVKDSGKLIPGHGGLLDRVDALLFNGPLVFAYVYWLRHLVVA